LTIPDIRRITEGNRVVATIRSSLLAFLLGLYPLSQVIAENAGVLPIGKGVLARSIIMALTTTGILLSGLRVVQRDLLTRSIWLAGILFLFGLYGPTLAVLEGVGHPVDPGDPWAATTFALASLAAATVAIRPWRVQRRDSASATVLAALLIGFNLGRGAANAAIMRLDPALQLPHLHAEPSSPLIKKTQTTVTRDIYYVILDGFGRADVLRKYYRSDLDGFIAFLRGKGFYVPDQSQSNYAQTFLSLASTLNLSYVDDVAEAVGDDSRDRRPLKALIDRNALMRAARTAGYRLIAIGSDYLATTDVDNVDLCACQQYGLDELQVGMLSVTPFAGLPIDRWTYGAHRRKVMESFASIEELSALAGPKLVFAHVIAPHPPFVFEANGSPRQPAGRFFGFHDGDHYRGPKGEYFTGYRDQVQFVAARLRRIVESLLNRPGPPPVIVLHGDHGPGLALRWEDARGTRTDERMGIFAAYLFPDGPDLYPTITPINGARALARQYLGLDTALPLPDRSFFSTWLRPYQFVAVPLPPAPDRSASPGSSERR
jgi:hypothetical protein